jgi:hypothetical protein
LKEGDPLDDPDQGGLARYWKTSRREERAGKQSKDCGKKKKI